MPEAGRRVWIGFGAVLFIAFAVRVARLDSRALWWDEGLTLFFARLSFAENARYAVRLADTNPPVYRLLVGGWTAVAGTSAFATRLFSAFAGVVTVAAVMRLGRDWRGGGLALVGGGLAAASPMLVYFSQEAKAYSLVAACGALASLICVRLMRRGGRPSAGRWLAYGLALAVALGSHYITIFLIGAQAAWIGWAQTRHTSGESGSLNAWWSRLKPNSVQMSYSPRRRARTPHLRMRPELAHMKGIRQTPHLRMRPALAHTKGIRQTPHLRMRPALAHMKGIRLKRVLHVALSRRDLLYFAATLALVAAVQLPYWWLTYSGTRAVVRGETGDFAGLHGPADFFGTHWLEFAVGPGAKSEGYRGNGVIEGKEGTEGNEGNGRDERSSSAEAMLYWAAAVGLGLLAAAGLLAGRQGQRREQFSQVAQFPFYFLSLLLIPLLAGFGLNLIHEFFFPRFLLYSVPAFLLLAAGGLAGLWEGGRGWRLGAAGLAGLVTAGWAVYLSGYYAGPGAGAQAEDWRPLASALRGHTRPGDAAVYGRGWMPGYLHAYLPPAPEPDYFLAHFSPESLGPELASIASTHPRIWLLDYQTDAFDARNPAGRWLGERGALVYDEWFGNSHVALFVPGDSSTDPAAGEASHAEFANGLQLAWRPVDAQAQSGDAFALALDWSAPPDRAPERRYTVFLHGLAADGSLAFGRDSEPGNGLRSTVGWTAGEHVREWRGALLPPELPAGEYALQVGLYDTLTGEAIPASDGRNAVALGRLSVR